MKTKQRRFQAWTLLAYSLSVMATNFMGHGVLRKTSIGISAIVLAVAVALMVRARWRGGCPSTDL